MELKKEANVETNQLLIAIAGLGDFGCEIISLLDKMLVEGVAMIKVTDQNQSDYFKQTSESYLIFLCFDANKRNDLLTAKMLGERSKMAGSIVIMCASNLKEPSFQLVNNAADTIIIMGKRKSKEIFANFIKQLVKCFSPSLIGLDYSDLRTFLKEGKIALLAIGEAKGKDKAGKASNKVFSKLDKNMAKGLCILILCGTQINLREIDTIGSVAVEALPKNAHVFWGARCDDEFGNKIKLYCLITYNGEMFKELIK